MNKLLQKAQEAYLRNRTGLIAEDIPSNIRTLITEHHVLFTSCEEVRGLAAKFYEQASKTAQLSEYMAISLSTLAQKSPTAPANVFTVSDVQVAFKNVMNDFSNEFRVEFEVPFGELCDQLKHIARMERAVKESNSSYNLARMKLHDMAPECLENPNQRVDDPLTDRQRVIVLELGYAFRVTCDQIKAEIEQVGAQAKMDRLMTSLQRVFSKFAQRVGANFTVDSSAPLPSPSLSSGVSTTPASLLGVSPSPALANEPNWGFTQDTNNGGAPPLPSRGRKPVPPPRSNAPADSSNGLAALFGDLNTSSPATPQADSNTDSFPVFFPDSNTEATPAAMDDFDINTPAAEPLQQVPIPKQRFIEQSNSSAISMQDDFFAVQQPSRPALRIFCGTWNMAQSPPPSNLDEWTFPGQFRGLQSPDIIALGVQESEYTTGPMPINVDVDLQRRFETALNSSIKGVGQYTCVACANIAQMFQIQIGRDSKQNRDVPASVALQAAGRVATPAGEGGWKLPNMGGLITRLYVFVRKEMADDLQDLRTSNVSTGVGGVGYNKGGVGISMRIGGVGLCFVSSHFAAHQDQVSDRNADFANISGGLDLGKKGVEAGNQFHYMFWMGDLNYRVDSQRQAVLDAVDKGDYFSLLPEEQLCKERSEGRVFLGYKEGEIKFAPSYKFQVGTDEYEEKKKRVPSWCDRVLYKTFPGMPITQLAYMSVPAIKSSDHKPVYAVFDIPHPTIQGKIAPIPKDTSGVADVLVRDLTVLLDSTQQQRDLEVTVMQPHISGASSITYKIHHNEPSFCPEIRFRTRVFWNHLEQAWDLTHVIIAVTKNNKVRVGEAVLHLIHPDTKALPTEPRKFYAIIIRNGASTGQCAGWFQVNLTTSS